ncbi:hypothetical protein VYU27_010333, partial [Nannochloropsis oceanica]
GTAEGKWIGVDVDTEGVVDTFATGVWEPTVNKVNALSAATEAACVILAIDETVRNPRSQQPGEADRNGVGLGRGGGPVSAGMGGGGMAGMVGGGRGGGRGGGMPRGVKAFKGRGGA